jgi:NDP-sugar pyrophosphorylase family protein
MKKKLQIRQLDLNGYWLDIGTHENIKEINTKLKSEISH